MIHTRRCATFALRGRVTLVLASTALCFMPLACGGGNADKETLQAAVDSITKQRDSTIANMDSAGVVHSDTVRRADSARAVDTTRRDTTRAKPIP